MARQIKLRIFEDGTVQAEVQGIKGKKCTDYISIIEDLLEAETVDSNYTPEYYKKEVVEIKQEENIKLNGKI